MKITCPNCNGTGDFATFAPAPVPFIPCETCRATGEVDAKCCYCDKPAIFEEDGRHYCSLVCEREDAIEQQATDDLKLADLVCPKCEGFRLPELGCWCEEERA